MTSQGCENHLIPGQGSIAWNELAELVPATALPTCEFDWYYGADEIQRGVAFLAAQGLVAWPAEPSREESVSET